MKKLRSQEIALRRQAVENAVATQRLEGLEVDPVTREDLERYVRGEVGVNDILEGIRRRIAAGGFREPDDQ